MSEVKSLVAKLAEVMGEIGHVPKRGTNTFHNYKYVMEADLCDAVRERLAKRKVVMIPSVLSATREKVTMTNKRGETADAMLTDVMVEYTLYDGESGEQIKFSMPGCGADTGDKGVYKAITGSDKYALMKAFLIPTGDDPEADPETDARAEGFKQGSAADQQAVAQAKIAQLRASGFDQRHEALRQESAAHKSEPPTKEATIGITQPQQKRLYAIAKSNGWSDNDIHLLLKAHGYSHSREIPGRPKDVYEGICAEFEKSPVQKTDDPPGIKGDEINAKFAAANDDVPF